MTEQPIDKEDMLRDIEATHQVLNERFHTLLVEINHLIETNRRNGERIEKFEQILKEEKNEKNASSSIAFDDD